MEGLYKTDIKEFKLLKRGKVRDIYEIDGNLLIIATDRISAFDRVLKTPIPGKGKILTKISLFWFKHTSDIIENHLITGNFEEFPDKLKKYDVLRDRSILVRKAEVLPYEFIVRGYLAGSLYEKYKKGEITFKRHLSEFDRLPEPLFTPTTKSEVGHDMPISFENMKEELSEDLALYLRDLSFKLYKRGEEIASQKGITILDTKFEFGKIKDKIILIDEVLTPDSSRYRVRENEGPVKLDKQILRDYLKEEEAKRGTMPDTIPQDIVDKLLSAYKKLQDILLR